MRIHKLDIFQQKKKLEEKKSTLTFELRSANTNYKNLFKVEILKEYNVGLASVTIAKNSVGQGLYLVDEPKMSQQESAIYSKIMKQMYLSSRPTGDIPKEEMKEQLKEQITEITKSFGIYQLTHSILDKLMYYVLRDTFSYGILGTLIEDPEIEDILAENFNFPVGVVHRQFQEYGILNTNIKFQNLRDMNSQVQRLVQRCEKTITAAVPFVDAITNEGHRIAATFGKEVSLPGPNFAIRKFSADPFTIVSLIKFHTLSSLMAAYVWLLIDAKALILIVGPTSAGKTTTMGAFLGMMDPRYKITTIEDTPELRIAHQHWQRLITRKSYSIVESKYDIEMGPLIKLALRSRPDYIVVGEVRGDEALHLTQAAATGHGGITSFHSTDAKSALVRLASPPLNVKLAGQMLIWCMMRQNKVMHKGKMVRRILEITEVIPKLESIELKNVFEWDPTNDTYNPGDVDDLIKKSYRLKEIMKLTGYSKDQLKNEIIKRKEFLEHLVSEHKEKFNEVEKEFSKFNTQNLL